MVEIRDISEDEYDVGHAVKSIGEGPAVSTTSTSSTRHHAEDMYGKFDADPSVQGRGEALAVVQGPLHGLALVQALLYALALLQGPVLPLPALPLPAPLALLQGPALPLPAPLALLQGPALPLPALALLPGPALVQDGEPEVADAPGDDGFTVVRSRKFGMVRGLHPEGPYFVQPDEVSLVEVPSGVKTGSLRDVRKYRQSQRSGYVSTPEGPGYYIFGSYGPHSLEF